MLFTALRKYAVFTGRARRKEYWQLILLVFILTFAASVIDHVIGMPAVAGLPSDLGGPVENFVSIATLLPSLAVGWRRMHDIGKSGWISIAGFIPIALMLVIVSMELPSTGSLGELVGGLGWRVLVGLVGALLALAYLLYLLVKPGTSGSNRYGPDPKAPFAELERVFV